MANEMPLGEMLLEAGGGNSAPSPKEDKWSAAVMRITADRADPLWGFLLNTIIGVKGMS